VIQRTKVYSLSGCVTKNTVSLVDISCTARVEGTTVFVPSYKPNLSCFWASKKTYFLHVFSHLRSDTCTCRNPPCQECRSMNVQKCQKKYAWSRSNSSLSALFIFYTSVSRDIHDLPSCPGQDSRLQVHDIPLGDPLAGFISTPFSV